jgi:hypothetical protein
MKIASLLLTDLVLGLTSGAIAKSNGETITTHHSTSSTEGRVGRKILNRIAGHSNHPRSGGEQTPDNRASNAAQVKELREILENSKGQVFVHCGLGQRACSFSLAASGVDTDSIFEQARELGFPVQDEKLRVFLNSLKE